MFLIGTLFRSKSNAKQNIEKKRKEKMKNGIDSKEYQLKKSITVNTRRQHSTISVNVRFTGIAPILLNTYDHTINVAF